MIPFYIVISTLLLYPIVGWTAIYFTKNKPMLRKKFLFISGVATLMIILSSIFGTVTTCSNLNWFLITFPFLFVCLLLWTGRGLSNIAISRICIFLMAVIFGLGYLLSTVGFMFTLFAVSDLDTDQRKRLSDSIIYFERNVGQGPDPSIRLKEIEVYKKISWLPFIAAKVKKIVYDEWNTPLQQQLNVSYSPEKNLIYLNSQVKGYKTWNWKDTISLNSTSANKPFLR